MKRRTFVKGMIGLGATGLLTGMYAWQIEPFWLEFVRVAMPIKNLPDALVGKTLMQISDMHVGNRFRRSYLSNSLKRAQAFNPDIVVYTGDYVSYETSQQFDQLREVFGSVVKGRLGTVGIMGNHDYGKNWAQPEVADAIADILTEHGITVLRNAETDVAGLNIIGFDDFWGTNFAPEQVMSAYDPQKANLLLCHNPDVCDKPVWNGYQGWILAGHTHGGQCKPPFLPAPMLPVKNKRYSQGTIDLYDGRTLYINRALGHLWQVRFNMRPEITIFTLQKA